MVSYLVAFLISDFTCETAPSSIFSKPVQLCGEPNLIAQGFGKFQTNASAHIMKALESTYKYPYEMAKVDQIAVPEIYGVWGMENCFGYQGDACFTDFFKILHWKRGLVTYKDRWVLTVDEEPSQAFIEFLLYITSHELAHMWFGNLVTCTTWEGFWLNEGINTFAERIFYKTNPDFYAGTQIEKSLAAIMRDVDEKTPISGPDSDLTGQVYFKGGSLVRWSESIFGEDLFLEAIVAYLQKYAYESVVNDNFTAELDEFAQKENRLPSGKTMKGFFDSFLLQPGHPLVRVKVESGSGAAATISLTQEKYGLVETSQKYKYLWEFPIKFISDENPSIDSPPPDLWMSGPKITTTITIGPESWYIFNADGLGFYRVFYDDQLFDLLLAQLGKDHTVIDFNARSKLIFDYLSFCERGVASLEQSLSLTKYMRSEVDPVVWKSLFAGIEFMDKLLFSKTEYKDYWTPRLENLVNHLDINKQGELGLQAIFKATVFKKAATFRIPSFLKHSEALVQNWAAGATENPKPLIQVDYRLPIFCAAVIDPENSEFEGIFKTVKDNPKLTDLFVALGCSQNPEQIQTVLNYSLENDLLDYTQVDLLYTEVASNELMGSVLLKFWDQRFTQVVDKISRNKLVTLVKLLSSCVVKEEKRDELLEFVEKHREELGESADELTKAIGNNFNINAKFIKELGPAALKWFKENS